MEEMVEVVIHQLSYPEATLWADVPKQEWESKPRMMREILELIEKKVDGITYQESIAKARLEGKLIEAEDLESQLEQLVQRLEELDEEGNLEFLVEPVEIEEQMTSGQLSRAERMLLHPDYEW